MESLYLLIPISVLIVFIAIWAFLAMSDGGQFDDMLGPALRILQDDDRPQASSAEPAGDCPPMPEAKTPIKASDTGAETITKTYEQE